MGLMALDEDVLARVALHASIGHECYTTLVCAGALEHVIQAMHDDLDQSLLYGSRDPSDPVIPKGILSYASE